MQENWRMIIYIIVASPYVGSRCNFCVQLQFVWNMGNVDADVIDQLVILVSGVLSSGHMVGVSGSTSFLRFVISSPSHVEI